jgi:hypothetical protein
MWNFGINWPLWRRTGSHTEPVNVIRLGAAHTLHTIGGASAFEGYWSEVNFTRATRFGTISLQDIRKADLYMRRRLARVAYRADIERALARYARALDETDYDASLQKLWAILEFLTATQPHEPHTKTVRRAAAVWDDTEWHRIVLDNLRLRRNDSVHAGTGTDYAYTLTFHLKEYVEHLLHFHLSRRGEFSTRADVAAFLDLPEDSTVLRTEIARRRKALAFRGAK